MEICYLGQYLHKHSQSKQECKVCKHTTDTLLMCEKCAFTSYCSKRCQEKDWVNHKDICGNVEISSHISELDQGVLTYLAQFLTLDDLKNFRMVSKVGYSIR